MRNTLALLFASCIAILTNFAAAEDYNAIGTVKFSNLQELLAEVTTVPEGEPEFSAIVPLKAKQFSDFNGRAVQTGSITATSLARPADQLDLDELQDSLDRVGQSIDFEAYDLILTFTGVQGPNPQFGKRPLQVIRGRGGQVFTTWVARFYVFLDLETGQAVLSGDGDFTVVGGTGQNAEASGEFLTIFITDPLPLSADSAEAAYWQVGEINR
jgi:hypothetical protein